MRKLLTAILSFALVLMTMANLATLPAQAAPSPSEEAAQAQANLAELEAELALLGTDVVSELSQLRSTLTSELDLSNGDVDTLTPLIETLEQLEGEYEAHNLGYAPRGVFHPALSPIVAAVIAYFNAKGYYLSAELLTHAVNNKAVNSTYRPYGAWRVEASSVWRGIRSGTKAKGSSAFPNSGGTQQKDLYYAIHRFDWVKSGAKVTLRDRYDFAPGRYDGIAGAAVNTMVMAQRAGVIVPYYVVITR